MKKFREMFGLIARMTFLQWSCPKWCCLWGDWPEGWVSSKAGCYNRSWDRFLLWSHFSERPIGSASSNPKSWSFRSNYRGKSEPTYHTVVEPHGGHKIRQFADLVVGHRDAFQISQQLQSIWQTRQQIIVDPQFFQPANGKKFNWSKNYRNFERRSRRERGRRRCLIESENFHKLSMPSGVCRRETHKSRVGNRKCISNCVFVCKWFYFQSLNFAADCKRSGFVSNLFARRHPSVSRKSRQSNGVSEGEKPKVL